MAKLPVEPVKVETEKAPPPPPFKIETASERQRYLKALFYGDYGVGKTFLSGTCVEVPQMDDILMINAESGDETLDSDEYDFDKIDFIPVKSWHVLDRVYAYLRVHCSLRDIGDDESTEKLVNAEARFRGIKPSDITNPRRYRTALMDSLTELETYCMNQLLGIKDSTKLDEETAVAEWGEFRRNRHMVRRMVRSFRDLPINVIYTAGVQYEQDEMKKSKYFPAMTGQLRNDVQGFMDLVGYYVAGNAREDGTIPRRLYVQPQPKWKAKCRFSKFKKPYFDDPTIKTILEQVGLLKAS